MFGNMDSKSSGGMGIKTTMGVDLRNAPPVEESKQASCGPACCDVGPAGFSITERATPGVTGGMGNAKVMNSDDQMPGPAYP